jgi:hypothetical protein
LILIASCKCQLTYNVGKVTKDNVHGSTNQGAVLARIEGQCALLVRGEVAGAQGISQSIKHKLNVIGAAKEKNY